MLNRRFGFVFLSSALCALAAAACADQSKRFGMADGGGSDTDTTGSGGSMGTGGSSATGVRAGSGGVSGTGGAQGSSGGRSGTGGVAGSGGGATGGAGGAGADCRPLSQPQCLAAPAPGASGASGCSVRTCPGCAGGTMFSGCFPASEPLPACPPLAGCPPNCEGLAEAACRANPACRADSCPRCDGTSGYVGCSSRLAAPGLCPALACPVACGQVTTLADCDGRADCHSVFVDSQLCGCASLGCCAHFSRCAAGDKAACTASKPGGCDAVTPHCEGPYVVAYTATCFEGCVKQTDCAP